MSRLFSNRPGDDGLPGSERRLAVLALILGTTMAVMDNSMVNLALPSIAADLEVASADAVWVTNLFQVTCAAFLLVFAAVSELVGRRRVYMGGLVLFALAALGCALSRSLEALLAFRALQGVAAAATLSIGPSLYRAIFPSRLLGSALGLSSLVVGIGYAAGPALGGSILSVASWPWLFALPAMGAVALAWRALPREPGRRGGFDGWGALLAMATLGGFFMALDGNGAELPGLETLGWLALSLATGAAFLARQRRAPYPLMALSMFEERRFTLAVSSQGLAFVGQGLAFVALSFLYQQGMGFSPLETAWLFTPWPLTIMVAGPLAGRLADRLNPSLLSSAGLVLLMVGLGSLARLEADAEVIDCLWRTALCGLGFGFFQPPNNRELMGSVPAEKSANASGVMSTTRTVGQSLGVALVGACLAAGAPVQVALWAGVIATGLSLMASLGRVSLAGEAQRARRRAAVERVQ
ncbi:Multidrug resistance protein stp [Halomonas sp. THAF12]|uniref:MFS transporter n=1 Tax=Halomonas sp. THAF12 TaxID=2587849 RepID=UPI0012690661|nr:MFS transporter [Halomonas sp. THAF12]QFT86324.1 Multidrug resistance protein stp [Halomonas sp. THAF12]